MSLNRAAAVRIALVSGLGATAVSLLAGGVTMATGSATTAILVRALLVTALLLFVVPWFLDRPSVHLARQQVAPSVLVGGLVGYLLDLGSWTGRGYAAQLVIDPGRLTTVLDLLLWLGLLWLGVRWRVPLAERTEPGEQPAGYLA